MELLAARSQRALTLGFHIVLACFGVGLPVLLLIAKGRYAVIGGWCLGPYPLREGARRRLAHDGLGDAGGGALVVPARVYLMVLFKKRPAARES